jgi:hypothetical protein
MDGEHDEVISSVGSSMKRPLPDQPDQPDDAALQVLTVFQSFIHASQSFISGGCNAFLTMPLGGQAAAHRNRWA